MDVKLLKTFVAVANHSSFTGAAKELFIAQSAVSKHITQLERELEMQLFLRDTRMVRLTPAGESLYRDGLEILEKIDAAVANMKGNAPLHTGKLSVGVFSSLSGEVVDLLRQFQNQYPNITVTMDWHEFGELIRQLEAGELDVIFTVAFAIFQKPMLRWVPISKPAPLQVVVGRNSPLASKPAVYLSDLTGRPFFTMRPDITPDGYACQMAFFLESQFEPAHIVQHTSHESMLLQLQLHDDAFGLMRDYLYQEHPGVRFIPLLDDIGRWQDTYALSVAWHSNNENPCVPLLLSAAQQHWNS